jgi:hypothetical protein
MLVKEPIERITSSDVVELLEKEKINRVKDNLKRCLIYYFKSPVLILLKFTPDFDLSFKKKFKRGRNRETDTRRCGHQRQRPKWIDTTTTRSGKQNWK